MNIDIRTSKQPAKTCFYTHWDSDNMTLSLKPLLLQHKN